MGWGGESGREVVVGGWAGGWLGGLEGGRWVGWRCVFVAWGGARASVVSLHRGRAVVATACGRTLVGVVVAVV